MKKLLLIIAVLTLFLSCKEKNTSKDPLVRGYLSSEYTYYYVALGTVSSAGYTADTEWSYVEGGTFGSYMSVEPGTYNVIYDGDSDHSTAFVTNEMYSFTSNKKYTVSYISDTITVSED